MGEWRVATEMHRQARESRLLTDGDLMALGYDAWGQYAYYQQTREYVMDQRRFIGACMARGLDNVLESHERF